MELTAYGHAHEFSVLVRDGNVHVGGQVAAVELGSEVLMPADKLESASETAERVGSVNGKSRTCPMCC